MPPLKPSEIVATKTREIPDFVFDIFNKLIAKNWDGRSAVVRQSDVTNAFGSYSPREVLHNGWLDIEECYRDVGWKVEYDKPGFNESYDATYTFRPAR